MIAHLEDRAAALMARGWTRREAEWLALVCLHSGVFLRSQYLAFIDRTNPALANRFVLRCRKHAVEQPWNGSRLRLCRIAARADLPGARRRAHPASPARCAGGRAAAAAIARLPARTSAHRVALDRGRQGGRVHRGGHRQERAAAQALPGRGRRAVSVLSPQAAGRARHLAGDVRVDPSRGRDGQRGSDMGLAACRAVAGARRGRPRHRGCRRGPGPGTSGGGRAGAGAVGLDASGIGDDGPRGGGGGDGRDQEGDRDERLGRPGGVRRPESRVATHARPQRRLRRKPPVDGVAARTPRFATT